MIGLVLKRLESALSPVLTYLKTKRMLLLALVPVLLLAVYLRFAHISEQGILSYDEAWYLLVAQSYCLLPKFLSMVASGADAKEAFNQLYSWKINPHISYKPSYQVFLIALKGLMGATNTTSAAVLSAGFGLVCVGLVGYLVKKVTESHLWGWAALMLTATSGYMVRYSRLGGPYSAGTFIFLLYLCVYQARLKLASLAQALSLTQQYGLGVLLGLTVTFYDTLLPIMFLLLLIELGVLGFMEKLWQHSKKLFLKRAFLFTLGMLTPTLFWEVVVIILRKIFHRTVHKGYVTPYIKQVLEHVTAHKVETGHFSEGKVDYGYFAQLFSMTDGVLFVVLSLLGLVFLTVLSIRSKLENKALAFLAGLGWVVLFLLTIYPSKIARMAAPFFPLMLIVLILACWQFVQLFHPKPLSEHDELERHEIFRNKHHKSNVTKTGVYHKMAMVLIGALFATLMISGFRYSYGLTQVKSGYPEAIGLLQRKLGDDENIATPMLWPIYTAYLQKRIQRFHSYDEFLKVLAPEKHVAFIVFDTPNLARMSQFCKTEKDVSCLEYPDMLKQTDAIENYLKVFSPQQWRIENTALKAFPLYWEDHHPLPFSQYLLTHPEVTEYGQIRIYRTPQKVDVSVIKQFETE